MGTARGVGNVSAADLDVSYDPADRRIVLGGAFTTGGSNPSTARVVRLNDNGSLDTNFGDYGWVDTGVVSSYQAPVDVVAYGGKVTVAAPAADTFQPANGSRVVVSRFDATGSPDMTFGVGGKLTTALGSSWDADGGIALDQTPGHEGEVLVGGTPTGGGLGVVRLGTGNALTATLNAPTGLTATPASTSEIDLNWTNTSAAATAIEVQRSTDGTTWATLVTITNTATTTYSDTGLAEGMPYAYRVRASASSASSVYTDPVGAAPEPLAPSDLAATAGPVGTVELSWADHSAHEDGYAILRSSDGVNFTVIDTTDADSTSYTDATPVNDAVNYYEVVAGGFGVDSDSSAAASCTPIAPPTGSDDHYFVVHDRALVVGGTGEPPALLANDTDPAGLPINVGSNTDPSHGTLTALDPATGAFTYTPNAGWTGIDTFTYIPVNVSEWGTDVTVTIAVTNRAPCASGTTLNVAAGSALTSVGVSDPYSALLATDDDGDTLHYHLAPGGGPLHAASFTLNGDGSYSYQPAAGFVGLDRFSFVAGDGAADSNPASVTIDVTKSQPLAVPGNLYTQKDQPFGIFAADPTQFPGVNVYTTPGNLSSSVLGNSLDVDESQFSLPSLTTALGGTLDYSAGDHLVYYPPAGVDDAVDRFQFSFGPDSPPATVYVGIGRAYTSEWPGLGGRRYDGPQGSVPHGTSRSFSGVDGLLYGAQDYYGGTLSVASYTQPQHGSVVVNANGSFTFTADANFSGWTGFTYVAHSTDHGDSQPVGVAVEVGDHVPAVQNAGVWTYAGQPQVLDLRPLGSDEEGDALSVLELPQALAAQHGTVTDNHDGTVTYTPAAGYTGPDRFGFRQGDGVTTTGHGSGGSSDVTGSGYGAVFVDVRPLEASLSLGTDAPGDPDATVPLDDGTASPGNLVPLHMNLPVGLPKGTTVELSVNSGAADKVDVFPARDASDPGTRLIGAGVGTSVTWTVGGADEPPAEVYVLGKAASDYDEVVFTLKVTAGDDGGTNFFGNPGTTTSPTSQPTTKSGTQPSATTQTATVPGKRGLLIAFDGTWDRPDKDLSPAPLDPKRRGGPWNGSTAIYKFFKDYYKTTDKKYFEGVGHAGEGVIGHLINGAFGFDAATFLHRAQNFVRGFYQNPDNRGVPLDVIGYSRGAFEGAQPRQLGHGKGPHPGPDEVEVVLPNRTHHRPGQGVRQVHPRGRALPRCREPGGADGFGVHPPRPVLGQERVCGCDTHGAATRRGS